MTTDAERDLPERDDGVLHCRAAVDASTVSDEDRTVEVIASTEDIDAHGTVIRSNWDLDRFRANPVVLFSHDARELPIGIASDVRVADGELRAKVEFSTEDLNPRAEAIWKNVKAKKIRGVSVGFRSRTARMEKLNDREVLVLDDNELVEISMTPVPSNPAALAQLRARAIGGTEPEPKTDPIPAAPAAPPEPPEKPTMTTPEDKNAAATPTVIRALGLPAGSSESDALSAATRLRELELQVVAITGVQSSAEALGAVRALKATADQAKALREELNQVRGERDKQNFEALIQRGVNEGKLSVAEANFEREKFDRKVAEGRGTEAVEELKGFIAIAQTRRNPPAKQPASDGAGSGPLTHDGKSYREMKPIERHRLWQQNPELWRLMKDDFESNRAA